MTRPRTTRLALAAALTFTLTACSAPEEFEVPEIVWENGPPTGEFEDTEWVKTIREFELLNRVAWNARDYSDPRLLDVADRETYGFLTAEWDIQSDTPLVWVGPLPLRPLSVTVSNDGTTVTVKSCALSGWFIAKDHPEPTPDHTYGYTHELERSKDGRIHVTDSVPSSSEHPCDPDAIHRATFNPYPTIPETDTDYRVPGPLVTTTPTTP